MTLFIIMGNDFPAAIASTEEKAEKILAIAHKRWEARGQESRLYWRKYEMELDTYNGEKV